jgi:hypothetical protein
MKVARESGALPYELVGCRLQGWWAIQDRWWGKRMGANPVIESTTFASL